MLARGFAAAGTHAIGQQSFHTSNVRFFYLMGFTVIFRYNTQKLTLLSIRSSAQKPLKLYQKR